MPYEVILSVVIRPDGKRDAGYPVAGIGYISVTAETVAADLLPVISNDIRRRRLRCQQCRREPCDQQSNGQKDRQDFS